MKILYVGGYGRSGSTLVGRVLGELPSAVCVGETRYLWSRGILNNVDCGCGQPFLSCPFWNAVGDEAFGGWNRIDAARLAEVDRLANRRGTLPFYWAPRLRPKLTATIRDYAAHLGALYAAISRISGRHTIVETSKEPAFACLLKTIPQCDVRIIHLVRDSRAVAYSWTRRKRLASPIGRQQFMGQFDPTKTATMWMIWNAAFHALASGDARYLRMTYESFVAEPRSALETLSAFANETVLPSSPQLTSTEVKLTDDHIFSGNPMRTVTGWVPIRPDNEWHSHLSVSQFVKATAITWPLLRHYGYPIMPAERSARVGQG